MRRASASPLVRAFSFGLLHLLAEGAGLAGILLPLLPQAVRLVLSLLQPLALLLQLGQYILEPHGFAVHLGLGGLDDALVQPQPPRDGEGVGLAGDADKQPVGGPQGLHVELAAGILHPRRSHGEGFQLRIVGGGRRQRPPFPRTSWMMAMASAAPSTGSVPRPARRTGSGSGHPPASGSPQCWPCGPRRWTGSARCSAHRPRPPECGQTPARRCRPRRGCGGRTGPSGSEARWSLGSRSCRRCWDR